MKDNASRITQVLALLTLLEVKGVVQRLPGRHVCLKQAK